MPMKVVENKGDSVMFVGGKMIFPGAAELVDVPDDAEADAAAVAADGGEAEADSDAALIALQKRKVADILPDMRALTEDALARFEALERAGLGRKGLLAELTAERLKRAASSGGEEQAGEDKDREEQAGEEQGQGSAEATQPGGAEQGAGAGEGGAA